MKQHVVRDVDDGDDEGGWEEVTGKGGAPLVVVSHFYYYHIIKDTKNKQYWLQFLIQVNNVSYRMSVVLLRCLIVPEIMNERVSEVFLHQ
jgi:hypothetical protein